MATARSLAKLVILQSLTHSVCPLLASLRTSQSFSVRNMSVRPTSSGADVVSAVESRQLPSLSRNVERTLDPCVVLMKDLVGQYADLWKDKGGIYSLAQGVVYWKPPEQATNAMRQALEDPDGNLHLYGPDEGLFRLREALSEKIAVENQLKDHHVMVTVGANQAFVNCVITLLHEGDKCVVFAPFYFNHVMALQMTLPESSMVVGPSYDDGTPDVTWLQETLSNDPSIKVVTIVNPGNPTGTHLSPQLLQKAVDLCEQYNAWLVLDCTYEYFVPNSEFDGCFPNPHVLHIFSFSKAYALAGKSVEHALLQSSLLS